MRVIFLTLACLLVLAGTSQSPDPIPLQEAISYFEKEKQVKFAYDPELMEQIQAEFSIVAGLDDFITQVETNLPLTVNRISSEYFTISLTASAYQLVLTDSLKGIPISAFGTILVNGQPIPTSLKDNKWIFSYKPSSKDTVEVYASGYIRKQIPFKNLLNKKGFSVPLSLTTVQLAQVTIEDYLTSGIDMNPASQHISIRTADLPLLPGETDGDLFASLAALPGITTPDNRAGNLFIRGSPTDQSLILFDDIPIYHRGHYFGTISPYNPQVVENVEVYRNGFHPRMGGRVGGAVEIHSGQQPTDNPEMGIGTNSLYATGYAKIPLADRKVGISMGARRSYPYSFSSPKLRSISEMVFAASALMDSTTGKLQEDIEVLFEDYHGRLSFQPNDKNTFYFTSIFTRSKTAFEVNVPEENQVKNLGFNVQWKTDLTSKIKSSLSVTLSDYEFSYLIDEGIQTQTPDVRGGYSTNGIKDFSILEEFDLKLRNFNSLQFGVDYKLQRTNFDYKSGNPRNPTPIVHSAETQSHSLAPFANFEWNSLRKLYAQLGVRATYYSRTNELGVTPRMLVNYYPNNALTLKGSWGRYLQYLSQVKSLEFGSGGFDNELWLLADGQESKMISGTQSMLGGIVSAGTWIFDLEGYYKTAENVTYYTNKKFSNGPAEYYPADHMMYGVDFFIKKKLGGHASLWAGYSWSQSKIVLDSAMEVTYDAKYSQPHVYYLGGVVHKNNWKVSAGWKYGSGLNARSLDVINEENNFLNRPGAARPNAPQPQNPFADLPDRYAAVHMLDISASYSLPQTTSRKWAATFGISLINVYNQRNLTDKVTRAGMPAPIIEDRHAIQFAPNLMVMLEW